MGGSRGWRAVKTLLARAVTVLELHRGRAHKPSHYYSGDRIPRRGDTAQRPQQLIVHDATNHHASPGKPQLIRGVLNAVFYWLETTLGWLSANPVADSVEGASNSITRDIGPRG